MKYNLIEIDKNNECILIEADGVPVWVDYYKTKNEEGEFDGYYTWDFNMYIFNELSSYDMKIRATQEKICKDVENFDYFMDCVFDDMEGGGIDE